MKRKISYLFFLIILLMPITILAEVDLNNRQFTRSEMQDMVVSTALSYYYNRNYSDYEQMPMEDSKTFYWRRFDHSPENTSRSNYYATDCSAFVTSTYLYALGYDVLFDNNNIDASRAGQDHYLTFGRRSSTSNYESAIKADLNPNNTVGSHFSGDPTDQNVYYYKVDLKESYDNGWYNETQAEQDQLESEILNMLEPGDILLFRRRETEAHEDKSERGHVVIYIGDYYQEGEHGFIHSSGHYISSTSFSADSTFEIDANKLGGKKNLGDDSYSISYNNWDYFKTHYFFTNNENNSYPSNVNRRSYSFAIIRPINSFCDNNNNCHISENNNYTNLFKKVVYRDNFNQLIENSITRNKLSQVRIEQYQYRQTPSKVLNKNNSVNIGDTINYRVNFYNYSDNISGINIETKIPDNTEYIAGSCSNGCTYNATTNTISWNNLTAKNEEWLYPTYKVRVKTNHNGKVINEGAKVIYDGTSLKLGQMEVSINPTINSQNDINIFHNKIDELFNNGLSINNSMASVINDIYLDTLNIDLGEFEFKVKNAIFDKSGSYYTKKTQDEIAELINEDDITINKMLVSGMYGGRKLKGNSNGDRLGIFTKNGVNSSLETGDILITYDLTTENINMWLFYGFDNNSRMIFLGLENNELKLYNADTEITGWRIFKEMYSYDLFVVLRPTSALGTTVILDYNQQNKESDLFVAHNKYNNLMSPTREGYVFLGWYSDSEFNNKVTNTSNLVTTASHTLYAKWAKEITINYYQGNGTGTAGATLLGTLTCIYGEICTLDTYESLNGVFPHTNYRWKFYGWSVSQTGTTRDYTDGQTFANNSESDINLYAIGRRTFDFNSGEAPTNILTSVSEYWNPYSTNDAYLSSITLPIPTNIANWTFRGYLIGSYATTGRVTYDASLIGESVKPSYDFSTNVTFTSVYSRTATLTYNANGGSGTMASQSLQQYYNSGFVSGGVNNKAGESTIAFTLADNNYTREGYTFIGWSESSDGSNPMNPGTQYEYAPKVNEGSTKRLYAVWQSTSYLKGDMNRNNKIDLADIIILLKKYLGNDATSEELSIGDMNDNERIDLADIIILLKVYLKG